MPRRSSAALFVTPVLAVLSLCPAARANGVFPATGQIVVDPGDPDHIVVRTTYGLLTTRAAGEPWDWICESAVGYGSGFHPAIALTADGTLFAGLQDGLAVAAGDTCGWAKAPGKIDGIHVVDVSTERLDPSHSVAVSSGGAQDKAKLWESLDNAVTWTQAGADLPGGFLPLTVDVAPSDSLRVYVSGLAGSPGSYFGAIVRSLNRGVDWQVLPIPGSTPLSAPFIAAVHPDNEDVIYVRLDGAPGRLLVSNNGGAAWTEVFVGEGYLRGFALSPDGTRVLVGGDMDGLWRAPTDTLSFVKVSTVSSRCLTWSAAGVYTCATDFVDGFSVGLSKDDGATFAPVMRRPCVRGPLDCSPQTTAGGLCPAEWPATAMLIQQVSCEADAGVGDAGPEDDAGPGSGTTATGAGTTTGSAAAGGGAPSDPSSSSGLPPGSYGGGCGCGIEGQSRGGSFVAVLGAILAFVRRFRHRRRRAR